MIFFVLGEPGKEVMKYKAGDYFGELALLKDEPRAASIKAKVKSKKFLLIFKIIVIFLFCFFVFVLRTIFNST